MKMATSPLPAADGTMCGMVVRDKFWHPGATSRDIIEAHHHHARPPDSSTRGSRKPEVLWREIFLVNPSTNYEVVDYRWRTHWTLLNGYQSIMRLRTSCRKLQLSTHPHFSNISNQICKDNFRTPCIFLLQLFC